MRCELCASVGRYQVAGERTQALPAFGSGECEVCGSPLVEQRDLVLETIARLMRFGLTGRDLLARRGH